MTGTYVEIEYGHDTIISLARAVAVLNIFFVFVAVPEPSPQKLRISAAWQQADRFGAFKKVAKNKAIILLCVAELAYVLAEVSKCNKLCFYAIMQIMQPLF